MIRSSKVASVLAMACLAFFMASCPAAPASQPVALNPDVKEARELLDSWNGQGNALGDANTRLLRALKANPDDYLALKELARYQIKSGYINSRYAEYRKGNYYEVGNFAPGTLEQAEAALRRAIQINPRFGEGYVLLGNIQLNQTRLDEAAKSLARADELGTDDPWLQVNWARVESARGNYAAANQHAERVLSSSTANKGARGQAYAALTDGYQHTGEYDKAVALYEERIQLEPDDAWLRGNFAAFLNATLGRNDEAIAQARAALQIMDYGVGERTLAMALYGKWADLVAQGKAKEGQKYFKEASEIYPDLADVMANGASELAGEHLARALAKTTFISINARGDGGATALLTATNRNRADVVRRLLAMHADPNIPDSNGWTPLLGAADEGNTEIVNLLLAKGADVHARAPWNGQDAAAFAENSGNAELAAMLRKRAEAAK